MDAVVAGLGTGGTLMGTAARVRESNPGRDHRSGRAASGDPVMGLRSLDDGYVPPILDVSKLDRKLLVSNSESVAAVRALLDREGILAGVSAGAVVHVARRHRGRAARRSPTSSAILADGGWKYLSADFNLLPDGPRGVDGDQALVVVPEDHPRAAQGAREGRSPERVLRPDRVQGRDGLSSATSAAGPPPGVPLPLRARGASTREVWFLEDEGYEPGRLPLPPLLTAAPVAHGR